jgi:hypothetical protein
MVDNAPSLFRRSFGSASFLPGARLLLFVLVLVALQPAPILVTAGPRQSVATNRPTLGVHTRLTDEVEPWKIQRSLRLVREMGASWIVELFPWAYYHAEDGGFAWKHPDLVIEHAAAQDLTVVARLGLTPRPLPGGMKAKSTISSYGMSQT